MVRFDGVKDDMHVTRGPNEKNYQPFPRKGKLHDNSNLSLNALREIFGSDGTDVYCYVVASVPNEGGSFVQRGSGPNFQGDMVTLCTCKHYMRTALSPTDWESKWVAGFTGVGAGRGSNALMFLTKVDRAFESYHDLWYSEDIPADTKRAKSATLSSLGDLLEPIDELSDHFDHRGYHPPLDTHSHAPSNAWYGDVDRIGYGGRRAALLVGDPEHTFLWDRPRIFFSGSIGRGYRKIALNYLEAAPIGGQLFAHDNSQRDCTAF